MINDQAINPQENSNVRQPNRITTNQSNLSQSHTIAHAVYISYVFYKYCDKSKQVLIIKLKIPTMNGYARDWRKHNSHIQLYRDSITFHILKCGCIVIADVPQQKGKRHIYKRMFHSGPLISSSNLFPFFFALLSYGFVRTFRVPHCALYIYINTQSRVHINTECMKRNYTIGPTGEMLWPKAYLLCLCSQSLDSNACLPVSCDCRSMLYTRVCALLRVSHWWCPWLTTAE